MDHEYCREIFYNISEIEDCMAMLILFQRLFWVVLYMITVVGTVSLIRALISFWAQCTVTVDKRVCKKPLYKRKDFINAPCHKTITIEEVQAEPSTYINFGTKVYFRPHIMGALLRADRDCTLQQFPNNVPQKLSVTLEQLLYAKDEAHIELSAYALVDRFNDGFHVDRLDEMERNLLRNCRIAYPAY